MEPGMEPGVREEQGEAGHLDEWYPPSPQILPAARPGSGEASPVFKYQERAKDVGPSAKGCIVWHVM
ncbi:unnamed protein product [Pylaiella littoralis]